MAAAAAEGTVSILASNIEYSQRIIFNNVGVNYSVKIPPSLGHTCDGREHGGEAPVIVQHVGNGRTSNESNLATLSHYFQNHIIPAYQ